MTTTTPELSATLATRRRAAEARRDPRAVPLSMRTNMTVPESCAFYGIADSLTGCRVPRTCQDCLATPGCVIEGSLGRCAGPDTVWSPYWAQSDYHLQLQPGDRTKYYSDTGAVFFAANATYCDASDRVCAACHEDFQTMKREGTSVGGQFCVGHGGCVCVGSCEVPEQRAQYVYDQDCGQPAPLKVRQDLALPPVSSVKRDPRAPQADRFQRKPRVSECKFGDVDVDVKGCKQPRSCLSCLLRQECLVKGGDCFPIRGYDYHMDFRANTLVNESLWSMQLPAVNTTLCSQHNCETCRSTLSTWLPDPGRSMKPFNWSTCLDRVLGCVCPEFCDYVDATRSSSPDSTCLSIKSGSPWGEGVAAIVFIILVLLITNAWYKDTYPNRRPPPIQRQAHTVMRHMLDQLPAVPRLDLFGWRHYQQQLLQKEEELLGGAESVSPVFHHVNYDLMSPSAPDFDDDTTSAPALPNPTALASAPALLSPQDDGEIDVTLRRRSHATPSGRST